MSSGRRIPWPWIAGCAFLAALWLLTFYATGLLWWNAPDLYGSRTPRPPAAVVGVPTESAP